MSTNIVKGKLARVDLFNDVTNINPITEASVTIVEQNGNEYLTEKSINDNQKLAETIGEDILNLNIDTSGKLDKKNGQLNDFMVSDGNDYHWESIPFADTDKIF